MPIVELILTAIAGLLALLLFAAVIFAIQFRLRLRYFTKCDDLTGRVILITGANAGLLCLRDLHIYVHILYCTRALAISRTDAPQFLTLFVSSLQVWATRQQRSCCGSARAEW